MRDVTFMMPVAYSALYYCDGKSVTDVSKIIDVANSHMQSVIDLLENNGLIKSNKEGRIRRIWLTERGKDVREALKKLKSCAPFVFLKEPDWRLWDDKI